VVNDFIIIIIIINEFHRNASLKKNFSAAEVVQICVKIKVSEMQECFKAFSLICEHCWHCKLQSYSGMEVLLCVTKNLLDV